jgi:hypothetical protein
MDTTHSAILHLVMISAEVASLDFIKCMNHILRFFAASAYCGVIFKPPIMLFDYFGIAFDNNQNVPPVDGATRLIVVCLVVCWLFFSCCFLRGFAKKWLGE